MAWDDLAAKVEASEEMGRPYVWRRRNPELYLLVVWTVEGGEEQHQVRAEDVPAFAGALRERGIELQETPGS